MIDKVSARRVVRHYASESIDGLILAATTGEGMTLDDEETERLVSLVAVELGTTGRFLPIFLGLSGSDTRKLVKSLEHTATWPMDGYLIACPYYTRPSQQGMVRHFSALAEAAAQRIMIYNIPYRTGVNLGNAAMLESATHPNIVGATDCSTDMGQSVDLIERKLAGFAVLTGEGALLHPMLIEGADGGSSPPRTLHQKSSRPCMGCCIVMTDPARSRLGRRSPTCPRAMRMAAIPFVLLHGVGNGMLTIARGTLPLALLGSTGYGLRTGLLAAPARILQGGAPVVFGLVLDRAGPMAALLFSGGVMGIFLLALLLLRASYRPFAESLPSRGIGFHRRGNYRVVGRCRLGSIC